MAASTVSDRKGLKMITVVWVFLLTVFVGFAAAVIGGIIVVSPMQIASKPSVAFLAAGSVAGSMQAYNLGEWQMLLLGFVGAVGGIVGWFLYRLLVLRILL